MKLAIIIFIFFTGCTGLRFPPPVSFIIHENIIGLPLSIRGEQVWAYSKGYGDWWKANLKVYADDLERESKTLANIEEVDPIYAEGWIAAQEALEGYVKRMVARYGKDVTRAAIIEAIEFHETNQTLYPPSLISQPPGRLSE